MMLADDQATLKPGLRPDTKAAAAAPQGPSDAGFWVTLPGGGKVPHNHPLAAQAQTTAPAAPAPAAGTGTGQATTANQALTQNATVGAQPAQGSQTNVAQSFQQALVNRLNPQAVNAQNPAISGAIGANRLAEQRGAERFRNLAAERASAGGYSDSGAFDSQLMGAEQARAGREAAFEGDAVRGLQGEQDRMVMAALGLGGNMLGQQDSLGLQRYGIDTDAALRREGLGAQTGLGNRELDIRDQLGRGNLNLGLLGLLTQNDQFGQRLGADLGMFGANQDNMNWRALLGLG